MYTNRVHKVPDKCELLLAGLWFNASSSCFTLYLCHLLNTELCRSTTQVLSWINLWARDTRTLLIYWAEAGNNAASKSLKTMLSHSRKQITQGIWIRGPGGWWSKRKSFFKGWHWHEHLRDKNGMGRSWGRRCQAKKTRHDLKVILGGKQHQETGGCQLNPVQQFYLMTFTHWAKIHSKCSECQD